MKKTSIFIATLLYSLSFAQKTQDTTKVQTVKAVTIQAKKKLIERKADRLVFNVEASMASQGMDAVETLGNVPMMKVDENKGLISIVGKSSVSVMINGRMLNLSGDALMSYLKTIRSENILKVEVITTPPAKYEAQGNSGLINIVLKKNPNMGFSGNVGSTFVQRTYSGALGNATLNYQTSKFSMSLKGNYTNTAKRSEENYDIIGATSSYSRTVRKDMWKEFSPSINLSYKLSKNSEIGLNYLYTRQTPDMNIFNNTFYFKGEQPTETLSTPTKHRETNRMQTLSLYYDLKLDTLGKKLSFTGNYYENNSNTIVDFSTFKASDKTTDDVQTISKLKPQIFSGQADLELPFSFGTIETGVKFNQFKNTSDLNYYNIINQNPISNQSRTNFFQYDEKNYAAYMSFSKSFGTNWETKFGIRYEDAHVNAYTPATNERTKYGYGQWFPSAYVAYKEGKNSFSLAYSRRINRPDMSNLNPFRWYSNPNSYSSGNPLLQPAYINNTELAYTYNNKLSVSLYYLRLTNAFGQVATLDGIKESSTYLNHYNNNFYGLNASYTDKILPWWETSISATATLQNSSVFNIQAETKSGTFLNYSANNTFTLNAKKTIVFFLNYNQTLPFKNVNSSFKNFSDLSSGIRVSLMDKQLQINASVSNIFAQRYRADKSFSDNKQSFNNYWDGRTLRLSVNYTFGNSKVKGAQKDIKFEEKNRAN
ncbi:TonB-dependent receptor [Elizabethkingia miricola]|uniref:TonB-dependent receptor n=1 Tax=Elizabethkingia miricola TaxID=172045 RepID=A0ABD4DH90_ELIMR|nr:MULTISPECIES: outer membrane beta-barrel family protein [Elizabethkingia]KUY15614.1 TonB-dependent receptor [Elizabethkingia miricola]MCL1652021.1 outer membrane beta-barrel family protein [Elizabethkingia miricola]OPC69177.1 TonB-dependent receptor [Elizabethkingia miricola]OPC71715.1 TonB-dependent receptor [Elizabethkingia miricola]QCO47010.1 TonB-dependent receptor [Elizabethkingia sp. 2-6]